MSTYMAKDVGVVVLEDDEDHGQKIRDRLSRDGHSVQVLQSLDRERLLNYRALNNAAQIFIVDLVLEGNPNPETGLQLIREELWPIDRTTVFVVFSAHIGKRPLANLSTFEPHWVFVPKEIVAGVLTDASLDVLANMVGTVARYSDPRLEWPDHESRRVDASFRAFETNSAFTGVVRERLQHARARALESVRVIELCSRGCADFGRAGQVTTQLALAVYGSCGRLEIGRQSDIEVSCYYRVGADWDSAEVKAAAVQLWNRITRYIEAHAAPYTFEGRDDIRKNSEGLLLVTQVDEELTGGFMPIVPADRLHGELSATVRNRHWQILTEARAIFNNAFVVQLKREILEKRGGRSAVHLASNTYLNDIAAQFTMDAGAVDLRTIKQVKKMVMRHLNVLGTKLHVVRNVAFQGSSELLSPEGLSAFADSGLIKVIDFANAAAVESLESVFDHASRIVMFYALAVGQLEDLRTQSEVEQSDLAVVRGHLAKLVEEIGTLESSMKSYHAFDFTRTSSWLRMEPDSARIRNLQLQ